MSTLLYSAITSARKAQPEPPSGGGPPQQIGKFVDSLAALVPAEVLVAHAAILGFTTRASAGADGNTITTITDPGVLRGSFWALIVLAAFLYLAGQWGKVKPPDLVRVFIPPLAFVGWTMLQRTTAFDAVAPSWNVNAREAVAIIGAVFLAAIATLIAYRVNPN